jgi:Ni,Fe-hydrogenase III small subunit
MKEKPIPLKIFNFSHPLIQTEWMALMGDKYHRSLSFEWEMVNDIESAAVVTWDGIVTPRNRELVENMLTQLKGNKILLLIGESMTLLKNHPVVQSFETNELKIIEIPGWSLLPEEILGALETCHQKLNHV